MSCAPAGNPSACSRCATVTPRYVKLDIIDSGNTHSGSHWFEHDSGCTWKPILPNPGTGLAFAADSEINLSGIGLTISLFVDEEFGSSSLIPDITFDCGTVLNNLAVGVDLYTVTLSAIGDPFNQGLGFSWNWQERNNSELR